MKQVLDKNGTQLNLLKDTDLESGMNENGTFWKFPSGLLICIGKVTKNFNISNPTTNGFYDDGYSIIFPYEFVDTNYNVNAFLSNDESLIFIYSVVNTTKDSALVNVFSHAILENKQREVSFIAIGRWK